MKLRLLSNRRSQFILLFAAMVGFLVWALSPRLFGASEPWDSSIFAYVSVMVATGLVSGLLCTEGEMLLLGYCGIWFGQALALAVLPGFQRGWLLLGVITTAIGSLPTFVGAAAGWGLGSLFRARRAV